MVVVVYIKTGSQNDQDMSYKIVSLTGSTITSGNVVNSQINVSGIKGLVFVQLKSGEKTIATHKLIVN